MRLAIVSAALLAGAGLLGAQTVPQDKAEVTQTLIQPGAHGQGTAGMENLKPGSPGQLDARLQRQMQQATAMMTSCPVALRARQAGAVLERQAADRLLPGLAQWIRLQVAGRGKRRITAVNVTVRGYTDKSRMLDAGGAPATPDGAATVDVALPQTAGADDSVLVRLPGLTAVSFVDVNSVTYADGSTWKLGPESYCRTPVDGMMLAGGR